LAEFVKNVRGLASSESEGMGFTPWEQVWWMLGSVLFFHTSEFLLALAYHGRRVTVGSLLISVPYLVALGCALAEHALETWFVPRLKDQTYISYIGLGMIILGEVTRKLAVVTASRNFTHEIKVDWNSDHQLVTHGIYSYFRHPSYFGFFIWSIGTQVLLINPVCTVGYTVVTWRFFRDRIPYEEYFLQRFFEEEYEEYANRVPSGMPFIK